MNKKSKNLTFPISDTIPGPGTYDAEVTFNENNEVPTVKANGSIEHFGHGTAADVSSTTQAPKPFKD